MPSPGGLSLLWLTRSSGLSVPKTFSTAGESSVRGSKISSAKVLGAPMGGDVCYKNHAEVDQDDIDPLLTLLIAAGVNIVMGVPGA
jgi:hypothetical protein